MATPSQRLTERVRHDFPSHDADAVLEVLETIPESLPLGERQDPERLLALVLPACGNLETFEGLVKLARTDWRDALMGAELASGDWPSRLDAALERR